MPSIRSPHLAFAIALALLGCSTSSTAPNRVSIQTAESSYSAGATVVISVANVGQQAVTIEGPFCPVHLDRQVGAAWVDTGYGLLLACAGVALDLQPGQTVETSQLLPADLSTGMYRYRFEFDDAPSGRASNAFRVEGNE